VADLALDHRLAELGQHVAEELAVFGTADGLQGRAEKAHVVLLEDSGVREVDGEVQPRLAAERREETLRAFALDDAFEDGDGERLDVHAVGDVEVGHDGGGVRVDEDAAHALFAHRLAGLRARVVELGGLADDDRPGADDEDAGGLHRMPPWIRGKAAGHWLPGRWEEHGIIPSLPPCPGAGSHHAAETAADGTEGKDEEQQRGHEKLTGGQEEEERLEAADDDPERDGEAVVVDVAALVAEQPITECEQEQPETSSVPAKNRASTLPALPEVKSSLKNEATRKIAAMVKQVEAQANRTSGTVVAGRGGLMGALLRRTVLPGTFVTGATRTSCWGCEAAPSRRSRRGS
jgi:hypothetical protein